MTKTNRFNNDNKSLNNFLNTDKTTSILLFHLTTNEDIIANYTEQSDYYVLDNPISIAASREGITIIPWIPYVDSRVFIVSKSQVITTGEPQAELAAKYCELTGKIVLPPAPSIILQ